MKTFKDLSTLRPNIEQLRNGIKSGNFVALAQAITLVESNREQDQQLAQELLENLIPHSKPSIRIGITGIPGVGKSTFIESFGKLITSQNKKIAVLAIDPTSHKTRGSILGDKTRMEDLAKNPLAFIRPTAAGNALGGVAHHTREAILLCEAAGFDVVIIETVGVGQSETEVRNMVDYFLLLMLSGAGDELQGIKRGIIEMADGLVITKADGSNLERATQAQADLQYAVHLFPTPASQLMPKVLTCSSLNNQGIDDIWRDIVHYVDVTKANGYFEHNRLEQDLAWFDECTLRLAREYFIKNTSAESLRSELITKIKNKSVTPSRAAHELFKTIKR